MKTHINQNLDIGEKYLCFYQKDDFLNYGYKPINTINVIRNFTNANSARITDNFKLPAEQNNLFIKILNDRLWQRKELITLNNGEQTYFNFTDHFLHYKPKEYNTKEAITFFLRRANLDNVNWQDFVIMPLSVLRDKLIQNLAGKIQEDLKEANIINLINFRDQIRVMGEEPLARERLFRKELFAMLKHDKYSLCKIIRSTCIGMPVLKDHWEEFRKNQLKY